MIPIQDKIDTLRVARAEGVLRLAPETLERALRNDVPKPDVFPIARIAAVQAAKRTSDIIPLCHPLSLEHVDVELTPQGDRIRVCATVVHIGKTGVEMEALAAVSAACLTLYDMLKGIDIGMEIASVRLLDKQGGKSSYGYELPPEFRAAIVTTSDKVALGGREDKAGKAALSRLEKLGIAEPEYQVLPDDFGRIVAELERLLSRGVSLILTVGGTGLSARDVTVEAVSQVVEREIPGIMEAARAYGQRRTPYAMFSRGVAGQKGESVILTLPGSTRGCEETLNALFPAVLHVFDFSRRKAASSANSEG